MFLNIDELRKRDFQLSKINIIRQKPMYRNLVSEGRKANGFIYILHGTGTYTFENGSFDLCPGSLIYIPFNSIHKLEIHNDDIEFYRIDFNITINEEFVLFSDAPVEMCRNTPVECAESIKALADECEYNQDTIRKTELLCTILRTIDVKNANVNKERISPAIQYLLEHLTENIDCSFLAKSCNLSSSQFYNLFKAEYGMSPLEYRNKLIIKRASMLLRDGAFSITEISKMLGFESISYFSRFFKKHKGVSPSYFIKTY